MSGSKDYTHKVYVDFSGDDGDPNTPGSTKCICVAWILSRVEDVRYNEGIVLQMKKTIGCKKDAELKYSSLKRHSKKMDALELISQAKIQVVLAPVVKTHIRDTYIRSPKTKRLVALLYYFPISRLLPYLRLSEGKWFQVIFDEIAWRDCRENVKDMFSNDKKIVWDREKGKEDLQFLKSASNLMLQLADVVAGLGHEYIESLQEAKLPPCVVCAVKGRPDRPCSHKEGKSQLLNDKLMRIIYPLLVRENGRVWDSGFVVRPFGVCRDYMFVDCVFGAK